MSHELQLCILLWSVDHCQKALEQMCCPPESSQKMKSQF